MFVIFLVVQGGLFLLWSIIAFRWLIEPLIDAGAFSRRNFLSISLHLQAFRAGLVDSRYRRHRVRLLLLTPLLLVLSALSPFFLT